MHDATFSTNYSNITSYLKPVLKWKVTLQEVNSKSHFQIQPFSIRILIGFNRLKWNLKELWLTFSNLLLRVGDCTCILFFFLWAHVFFFHTFRYALRWAGDLWTMTVAKAAILWLQSGKKQLKWKDWCIFKCSDNTVDVHVWMVMSILHQY